MNNIILEDLIEDLKNLSRKECEDKYKVSGSTIKSWRRKYNINRGLGGRESKINIISRDSNKSNKLNKSSNIEILKLSNSVYENTLKEKEKARNEFESSGQYSKLLKEISNSKNPQSHFGSNEQFINSKKNLKTSSKRSVDKDNSECNENSIQSQNNMISKEELDEVMFYVAHKMVDLRETETEFDPNYKFF